MKILTAIRRLSEHSFVDRIRGHRQQQQVVEQELRIKEGFHGDKHVLALADYFLKGASAFVETGSLAGTTACYVGSRYAVQVYSCEPDLAAWRAATERCAHLSNVKIFNTQSPKFLLDLFEKIPSLPDQRVVFWLDAHGYGFRWPLRSELQHITQRFRHAVIMIDDFKIPGRPEFGFDQYDGQECSTDYIAPALDPGREYTIVLPTYSEKTSTHHGLRGVGTIVYGDADFRLPEQLCSHFAAARLRLPGRHSPIEGRRIEPDSERL